MAVNIDMRLCLPRDEVSVPFVRHICQHVLTELSVTEDCRAAVLLALTEACDNVVLHATAEDEYEVHIDITAENCEVRVIDAGHGLDGSVLASMQAADADAESGRGLVLMRALVDSIKFESRPETGTIVHLVKQLEFERPSPLSRGRTMT